MLEVKPEEVKKAPQKITSYDQLKPGKLYRLHIHSQNDKKETTEVKTKDFYIEEKVDPRNNRFRFRKRVDVRVPHESSSGRNDLYASFRIKDFGGVFVEGSDRVLRNQDLEPLLTSSTVEYFTEIEDPGRPMSSPRHHDSRYHNWVEEIGTKP